MAMSNSELEERTRQLGYPRYSSVEKANSLAEKLMQEIPQELSNEEKELHFICPGIYFPDFTGSDPITDTTNFSTAVNLNTFLLATKELYRRNGLNFNEGNFLDDDTLCKILPPINALDARGIGRDANVKDLSREMPIPLIERIENEFCFLLQYDPRKTTPGFDKDIRKRIKKISEYANLINQSSDILRGVGLQTEAGALTEATKALMGQGRLWEAVKNERTIAPLKSLIKAHAQLRGLRYSGPAWEFYDSMGHEITAVMDLARGIEWYTHVLSSSELGGQKNFSFDFNGYINFVPNALETEEEKRIWQEDSPGLLSQYIIAEDGVFSYYSRMNFSKSPFFNLEGKLTPFGVPKEKAKKIGEYLSHNILGRSYAFEEKDFESQEEIMREISREGKYFTPAVSQLIESVTGQKPNAFSYRFFKNSETAAADSIGPITYVAKLKDEDKNGN